MLSDDMNEKRGAGALSGASEKPEVYGKEKGGFYFAKVFIHGIVSDFHVKELKNGKKSIRLYVGISQGGYGNGDVPAEVEVCVERRRLVERARHFTNIGEAVLIEGRICLAFVKTAENVSKRIQYISAEEITVQRKD